MNIHRYSILALMLLMAACGKGEEGAGESTAPADESISPAELSIVIEPAAPTTLDSLRAVLPSSARGTGWRWEIDGIQVPSANTMTFPGGRAKRGHRVTVYAHVEGKVVSGRADIGNSLPQVKALYLDSADMRRGVDIRVTPEAEDVDGDAIGYDCTWTVNGGAVPGAYGLTLAGNLFARGDRVEVTVVPYDDRDRGAPYTSGAMTVGNAPPRLVSTPPATFGAAGFSYRAQAEDPDGDSLRFSLEGAPQGMRVDAESGQVLWPAPQFQVGDYRFFVVVEDGQGARDAQEVALSVSQPD